MEINRDSYLDQLIERKHNGLVKVISSSGTDPVGGLKMVE